MTLSSLVLFYRFILFLSQAENLVRVSVEDRLQVFSKNACVYDVKQSRMFSARHNAMK